MNVLSRLFLGVLVLTSSTMIAAASSNHVKANTTSLQLPNAPVIEPGSRLFAGDNKQNEFYILRKNEPDPVQPDVIKAATNKLDVNKTAQAGKARNIVAQQTSGNSRISKPSKIKNKLQEAKKKEQTKTFRVASKETMEKLKRDLHSVARGELGKHPHPKKMAVNQTRYVG